MTLIALKQICDQLKETIGLDDEHNVAALIDEDCDTEVKGWTIVSVSNSGEIKPCTSQSFSTIKELMYSWLEKQGKLIPQYVYPKFRIGDTIRLKGSVAEYTITSISGGCYHGKGWGLEIESEKDYELVAPKREWSEEDERLRTSCIKHIEEELERIRNDKYGHSEIISDLKESCRERINWLKFLRPQSHWKPSEGQMDALRYVTNFDYGGYKATLVSLYEQLKKLREE
jgi:hypothetical protein